MNKFCMILAVTTALPTVAVAQVAATVASPQLVLPANTEVAVTPNDNLTSKGMKEGDTFLMSSVFDVMYNGYVIIPRGTPGQGHVSWRTGKGAFGKSAKMEVAFDWLDLSGRRIALTGKHRQEGQGNSGAAIGAVVAVGVFGAFVTGKSAKIPHGMQMSARTGEALPIMLPAGAVPIPSAAIAPVQGASQTNNTAPVAAAQPTVPPVVK